MKTVHYFNQSFTSRMSSERIVESRFRTFLNRTKKLEDEDVRGRGSIIKIRN